MNMILGAMRPSSAMVSAAALALVIGPGLSSCSPASEQNASEQKAGAPVAAEQNATEQNAAVQDASTQDDATAQNARARLKAMSDYLAAQDAISLSYDTVFEVVTKESQKLQLATSGTIVLDRPDKIRATRKSGFADTETVYDGKTVSILGRGANAYVQAEVPGTIDTLIDQLRDRFHRQLPGADLLLQNVYGELMTDVTDVKDLGSGVIGGTECDHFAFRAKETDWQIWITQGENPRPCRYVITSKGVDQAPQFAMVIREWRAGAGAAGGDFAFKPPAGAKRMDAKDLQALKETSDLPENYRIGESR